MFGSQTPQAARAGLAGLLLTVLAACESPRSSPWEETEASLGRVVPATLAPGSLLDVSFPHVPELDRSRLVRPDGQLDLPMIGSVDVRGLTVEELEVQLSDAYSAYLKQPVVEVELRESGRRSVTVGGQVRSPSVLEIDDRLTVLEAVMMAGGPELERADVRGIVVIRMSGQYRKGFEVDLLPALQGERVRPFYLEPQDIVFVPLRGAGTF